MLKKINLKAFFVVLVAEQCWSGISALLSNQNHKNMFKSILLNNFHLGEHNS